MRNRTPPKGNALQLFMAKGIQDSMVRSLGSELVKAAPPELDVESAEVTALSVLKTSIRVTTKDGGTHYFTVLVSREWIEP